jgi:hypothetical protein
MDRDGEAVPSGLPEIRSFGPARLDDYGRGCASGIGGLRSIRLLIVLPMKGGVNRLLLRRRPLRPTNCCLRR